MEKAVEEIFNRKMRLGIKNKAMAERAGMSVSTLANIRRKPATAKVHQLRAMARVVGMAVNLSVAVDRSGYGMVNKLEWVSSIKEVQ